MASGHWPMVLRQVRRAFEGGAVAGLSEGQLLERLGGRADESALAAIVERHGPMVLATCRGVLRDPHQVDDAFQATFLVLVRKASGLGDREQLGPWLRGVARRVALRSRADGVKRARRERDGHECDLSPAAPGPDAALTEVRLLVLAEVDRLSRHERDAVVACDLEGLSHAEAAERLGWPIGTVKGRQARGRQRLRERLERRGLGQPAGALAMVMSRGAVPRELIFATTTAALRLASHPTMMAGVVPAAVATLVEGVVATMSVSRWKVATLAVATTLTLATPGVFAWQYGGMGGIGGGGNAAQQPRAKAKVKRVEKAAGVDRAKGEVPWGDPTTGVDSPEEFRNLNRDLSKKAEGVLEAFAKVKGNSGTPSIVPAWNDRINEDRMRGLADIDPVDRLLACQTQLKSLEQSYAAYRKEREAQPAPAPGSFDDLDVQLYKLDFEYRINDARRWLAEARQALRQPAPTEQAVVQGQVFAGGGGGGFGEPDSEPEPTPAELDRNKAILAKLEMVVSMKFEQPTPLPEVLRYIKECTKGPGEKAIQIYVKPGNPYGMPNPEVPKVSIDLDDIPLKTTLRLVVEQLGMRYQVKDGLILIDYAGSQMGGMGGMGGGMGGVGAFR